jgi:acetoin utilization deacetylase AcuC-like enzyme
MTKYRLLRESVEAALPEIRVSEALPASDGELALAHDPAWISAVAEGTTSAAQQREIGFPWSERMVERARRSVGATVLAARAALFGLTEPSGMSAIAGAAPRSATTRDPAEPARRPAGEGVAANLAGGTHHAHAHKGSGYCVFNDVAVAARLMQAEHHRLQAGLHGARGLRVLVIDLDVHQGNGTAAIFREDPTVFTLSMHGAKNFPFRKEASDLDVELPDGCSDGPYLERLEEALALAEARHGAEQPGLAFYLAGADPHRNDRLGRLHLSAEGLAERDRRVFEWLRRRRIPVALSMAGGYGRDLATTVAIQRRTLELALASWRAWEREGGGGARARSARAEEQCAP